jgi:hypothetical protein
MSTAWADGPEGMRVDYIVTTAMRCTAQSLMHLSHQRTGT